jgi:hypothetical protein
MEEVSEYELVTDADSANLNKRIAERIAAGWQLYGHPLVNGGQWGQALIRFKKQGQRPKSIPVFVP